ncbi:MULTISPECIES: ankyrin repeat domain-containing protein [unclassified Wolbachia]|uniref:ankyrin repeat domain-containing protein n=1 Tax=unclassified Wolbachia TaxID=2640676 RepID=UPI0009EF3242
MTLESEIKYETTPLHTLAKLGDELLSNVNDLLAGGADVNAMDKSEKTPLHYAAKNGHVKIVQVLLKADGINVNAVDEDGKTPFDLTTNEEIKALLQNAEKTDPVNESSTDSEGGQGEDAGASGEPSTPTQNHGGQTSTTSAEKGTDIKAEGVEAVAPIEPAQTEEQPSSFFGSLFSILMKPFSLIGSFLGGFFSWLFGSDEEKSDTQPYDDSSSPRVDQSVEQNNGDHNDQSNVI